MAIINQDVSVQPRRILFVADSLYWITATIARQICDYNPSIEPTLCSAPVLRRILDSHANRYPGEIDLVHFLTWQIATDFMPVFRPTTPCVVTIHHIEDERSVASVPDADAVMTVCHQWHAALVAQGTPPEKCVMVSNGVDVDMFQPASSKRKAALRRRFGIPPDSMCIGFSGKRTSNTHNRKGVETFVASARLLAHTKNMSLAIVGPGWADLVGELNRSGIACVYMPFLVDRREVADFYKAIDIYWVTSKIEGGPVPLLEAMSSGVACISSPVGVALEAIESNVTGFIAPFDAPDIYATITRRLAREPSEMIRVGQAARATIVNRFQSSQTTRTATRLYEVAEHRFRLRGGRVDPQPTSGTQDFLKNRQEPRLASLPQRIHADVVAHEHLAFMTDLLNAGASRPALRVGLRAIVTDPLNVDVWRKVIRVYPMIHLIVHRIIRSGRVVYASVRRVSTSVTSTIASSSHLPKSRWRMTCERAESRSSEMTTPFEEIQRSAHGMLPIEVYAELFERGRSSKGGTFVEIGTAHGAATIAMALGAKLQPNPFHIFTVDRFSGKYSSRTQFGDVEANIAFVKSQFQKFGVNDYITIVPGTVSDLMNLHDVRSIEVLFIDADGCIDRELAVLFERLSSECAVVIDDIDDWVGISRANGLAFLDQKHHLSKLLTSAFVNCGLLREESHVCSTGFFRKGIARLDPTQISLAALPLYRQLVFADVGHLPIHEHVPIAMGHRARRWVGDHVPLVRRIYRRLRGVLGHH
jgi:glycosyltransferase involved in cell wall biosynthesis